MKKYIIPTLFICLFGAASCTNGYEEANQQGPGITDEEKLRDDYALVSSFLEMQNNVIPIGVNTYQFTDCLLGGNYGGYIADSNPGFSTGNFANFNMPDNWSKVNFTDIIPKIFPNAVKIEGMTDKPVQLAVVEILKVAAMHRVTDTYGAIPYSKIGKTGVTAAYDTQEEVYNEMFKQLDGAINALTTHSTDNFNAKADAVYSGNAIAWAKYANSLKLRLAMRLAYVNPTLAQKKAEEVVNDAIGSFTSNSDNAYLNFSVENPLYVIAGTWNDSRASGDITSYMNAFSDPRREKYFTQSTFATPTVNGYIGIRPSIDVPAKNIAIQYSNLKGLAQESDKKLLWMNAAEVAFLKAEGALRGWNMGGTAENFYNQGIELSFDQWGVSGASTYYSNGNSSIVAYTDPVTAANSSGSIANLSLKYISTDPIETNLQRIITQKWIANYPLGMESWAEWRRTGYPKFMPSLNIKSAGINANLKARRLVYPQIEYTTNNTNVTNAVSETLGGSDRMYTNVWWDKK